jgi:hypothetical protein
MEHPVLAVASWLNYPDMEPFGWTRHMLADGTMVYPDDDTPVLP